VLDRFRRGHLHAFCEVRNLMHVFWGIWCTTQWPWCSCVSNLGMWLWNGDFSLLRINSWDVSPWGSVDRPKEFGGTCCPPLRVEKFFPSKPEAGNARFHQVVPMCQTPPHHIPWTHNLNTFYTETQILHAFVSF